MARNVAHRLQETSAAHYAHTENRLERKLPHQRPTLQPVAGTEDQIGKMLGL